MFQSFSLPIQLWTLSNDWLKLYWNIYWRCVFFLHFTFLSSNIPSSQMNGLSAFGQVTQDLGTSFINFLYPFWKVPTFNNTANFLLSQKHRLQVTKENYLFFKCDILCDILIQYKWPQCLQASQVLYLLYTKREFKPH